VGLMTVLEVLAKDETGVLQGSPGEVFGLSVPFVYRTGGLNFLNGVVGDEASGSRMSWTSALG